MARTVTGGSRILSLKLELLANFSEVTGVNPSQQKHVFHLVCVLGCFIYLLYMDFLWRYKKLYRAYLINAHRITNFLWLEMNSFKGDVTLQNLQIQ